MDEVKEAIRRTIENSGMPSICEGLDMDACVNQVYALSQEKFKKKFVAKGGIELSDEDIIFSGE